MTRRHWALLLLLSSLWGGAFLFLRIAVPSAGVALSTTARLGFAALLLGIVALRMGQLTGWRYKKRMALLALVNSAIPFALVNMAAETLPAGYLAIINASAPIQGLLIGVLFYHAAHNAKTWAGIGMGFCGVALLTSMGPVSMQMAQWLGVLAALGAALCYAITAYWTVHWFEGVSTTQLAFQNQLMAVGWLLPVLLAFPPSTLELSWTVWGSLIGVGALCTGFAYLLYFQLLKEVGPIPTSIVSYLTPCFAILWGWLFLNETIEWAHWAGLGCIVLAVRFMQCPATRKESTEASRIHDTAQP